ncbi:MAG: MATE family efflux transporter [Reichenbachiella sp.]
MAFPVMLSQMGHMMVTVADSIMVGQIGHIPLAAVSLASSIFIVVMLFGIGVSFGMTPLVAAADGANDKRESASILKHGILLNVVLGFLLVGVSFILEPLFYHMDQDVSVLEGAIPYFKILVYGLPPMMIFQSFRQYAEGLSKTKQAMYISISGNVVNVILNYIFIFGHFGVEAMGLEGAAWATLISRVLMAIAMGVFVFTFSEFRRSIKIFNSILVKWEVVKRILKIGIPSGLQFIFEVGAFSAAAIMVGWLGAIPLAAHQIALNLSAVTYMIATGIAAAGSIRMGNQLGRRDYVTLRNAGVSCFVMAGVLMVVFAILFVVFKTLLPQMYVDDAEVIEMASVLIVMAAIYQLPDGLQAVGLGALRGMRDTKIPTLVTLVSFWVVAIPLGYVAGIYFEWGAAGVWLGLIVGLTLAAIAHMMRFSSLTSKLIKENPKY